jgi:hypothetical protein
MPVPTEADVNKDGLINADEAANFIQKESVKDSAGVWVCGVTLWLHCGYTVVTLLLHCCYPPVALLSHHCNTTVTGRGVVDEDKLKAQSNALVCFFCFCIH